MEIQLFKNLDRSYEIRQFLLKEDNYLFLYFYNKFISALFYSNLFSSLETSRIKQNNFNLVPPEL